MKRENYSAAYPLNAQSVDLIAARIEEFLYSYKLERANVLRIRLSMEEALLRWMDHFSGETAVHLELATRWFRPTITLSLKGESFDPLTIAENDLGAWANSLLSGIGLTPHYSYDRGVNTVQLKLSQPRKNPALTLLISAALGVLLGVLGEYMLPETVQAGVLRSVLDPIQAVFFRILNAASGPVLFLSVLTAVCGVGSFAAMDKSGKRLIVRFLLLCTLITVFAAILSTALFHPNYIHTPLDGTQFNSVLDFFLQIVPNDMLSPFISGDSPQLILIALLLGDALLIAGSQAGGLVSLIEQADMIGLMVADWVSRLTPLFVSVLLILGIWNGSFALILDIWRPMLVFVALALVFLLLSLLRVSFEEKVSGNKLIKKMRESFVIALTTSSVDTAYGANQICCERRLGINRRLTDFGLPLGLVAYMPASAIATMVFTVYVAGRYGVTVSSIWYVMALFLTVALQMASPPVAGVDLLAYAVIFSRLGIPADALTIAMIADILFNFAACAVNQATLQLELVLEADRLELLDRDILRK